MTDRPILYSGGMVLAMLRGAKTETRRVLTSQPVKPHQATDGLWYDHLGFDSKPIVRHRVGDRLYVREAWRTRGYLDDKSPAELSKGEYIHYEADGAPGPWPFVGELRGRLRAGMHMPRWASRVTNLVNNVRVQRLQDISRDDAIAEGMIEDDGSEPDIWYCPGAHAERHGATPQEAYRWVWDSINEARGHGWSTNPWVVATSFGVATTNIDLL